VFLSSVPAGKTWRVRAFALLALALAAPALAGCGTGGREDDIRSVAGRFATAVSERDGAAACALLTTDAQQKLESDEGKPCRDAVVDLEVTDPPVRRVQVYVTSASARLAGGDWMFLDETTHGWRISAAGCEPVGGGLPYDCDLEV
jgi:hypothetical protein